MTISPVKLPNGKRGYLAQETVKNRHGVLMFFVSVVGLTHADAIKRAIEAMTRPA